MGIARLIDKTKMVSCSFLGYAIRQSWYLALGDLRQRYSVTNFGFLWLFIHPAMVFLIFYYMSVYGLKMGLDSQGVPSFAFLFCGLLPWMTLSECISTSTSCFSSHKALLFERSASSIVLVASAVLSSALMHIFLAFVVVCIFLVADINISAQIVMMPYYYFCLVSLCFVMSLVVSPLSARSSDAIQIINSLLLLWFWISPIIWPPNAISPGAIEYLSLNPVFYIIEGYRGGLIYPGHHHTLQAHIQFWIFILFGGAVGLILLLRSELRLREWLLR